MIQHINAKDRIPIRKAHYVGTSIVLTIDPVHVKRLSIDDMTFFIQRPTENGIVLELKKFESPTSGENQND
jgi:hypothetical protein